MRFSDFCLPSNPPHSADSTPRRLCPSREPLCFVGGDGSSGASDGLGCFFREVAGSRSHAGLPITAPKKVCENPDALDASTPPMCRKGLRAAHQRQGVGCTSHIWEADGGHRAAACRGCGIGVGGYPCCVNTIELCSAICGVDLLAGCLRPVETVRPRYPDSRRSKPRKAAVQVGACNVPNLPGTALSFCPS